MNVSAPKVSVIVPLYNKAAWVARCVTSVLRQTWQDFELIVVDDGSTDESASIVGSLSDDRIRLVAKKNGGEGSARNAGIRCAKGEFLAFIDADDEWRAPHLAVLLSAASACPEAIAVCDEYRGSSHSYLDLIKASAIGTVTVSGEAVGCYQFDYIENLAAGNFVTSCSSTMVRAHLLRGSRLEFNEKMGRGVDMNFWINLSRHGPFAYCNFNGARYHRDDPMSEMIRPRNSAQAMPDYFLDIPRSAFNTAQFAHIGRFLRVEYLKAAYSNRGLPFNRREMACVSLQRRRPLEDLLYLGVRFSPDAIMGLAKKVKGAKARTLHPAKSN